MYGISVEDMKNILYNIGTDEALKYMKMIDKCIFSPSTQINGLTLIYNETTKRFNVTRESATYTNVYDLFKNCYFLDEYDFLYYFDFNSLFNTNNFDDLINYILLDNSYIHIYDINEEKYCVSTDFDFRYNKNIKEDIKNLINNKVPFYIYPNTNNKSNVDVVYIGNQHGGYKIYNPIEIVSNEDYEQIKLYTLMKLV